MKNFLKSTFLILGVICAIYFAYVAAGKINKESIRRDHEVRRVDELKRMRVAQEKLASTFAACTAASLASKYLQDFIIHELMPLGIAWQLANLKKLDSSTDYLMAINNHLMRTLNRDDKYELVGHQQKQVNYYRDLVDKNFSSFNPSTYVSFPSIFIYKSMKSDDFKKINPTDIEIGSKNVSWNKFDVLAIRCKATPYDLDTLALDPNLSLNRLPDEEIELARNDSMKLGSSEHYSQFKREFWKKLTDTIEYKKSLIEVKSKNSRILSKIIDQHKSEELEEEILNKAKNDLIFIKP